MVGCQSGGHTGSFYYIAENKGFSLNKMVSIGNQCDLTFQDFIEYFTKDPRIKVITCYIEQVKNPKEFLRTLRKSAQKKPVIFWKGGQTEEGKIATASHTGAVSSSYEIFKATIEQNGGIVAESMEELADLTLGALFLSNKKLGENLGIVVPGGGSCVELMDNATKSGLKVPEFGPETRKKIQEMIQEVNTSTRNPVDLGMFGWLPIVISKTMSYAAEDPNIDVVIFYYMIERLPRFAERLNDKRLGKTFLNRFSRVIKKYSKPFICIIPNFINIDEEITEIRKSVVDKMSELRIPFFETMEKTTNIIKKLLKYQKFLERMEKR